MSTKTTTLPTLTASPGFSVKICSTPACKKKLVHNNSSGLCSSCQERLGMKSHKKHEGVNAHRKPQPAKPNGHDRLGNVIQGRVRLLLSAVELPPDALDALIETMPAPDKRRIVEAWLMGKAV